MRALRQFNVRVDLPESLAALRRLATNLRWTWHSPTRQLFASINEDLWQRVEANPVRLLIQTPASRFAELAKNQDFLARLAEVAADLDTYLTGPRHYQQVQEQAQPDGQLPLSIGYFSMEFGITEALPNYSGGLGVLAGDHLKAASDLGVPLIGVGLLYRSGYFRQSLSPEGWQLEHYPDVDPAQLPLELLTNADGTPVVIEVAMPQGRTLHARIWQVSVGRVPLLLLDSDVESNSQDLRAVTDRLYGGDQDHRIKQEILAGIGGVRAVRAYCELTGRPEPEVFHTNEGHAGFLGLERLRELMTDKGLDFDQALVAIRAGTVFTTHTPVPAGIDRFPVELVHSYFGDEQLLPGVPVDRLLSLGTEDNPALFNMAHMGLRLAQRANGVSRLHGEVSRNMFRGLWPGFDIDEVPINSVTNGVHGPTWTADAVIELPVDAVSDAQLWQTRCALRAELVNEIRRRVRASSLQRGACELELGWTESVFDPNVLTIGFARRVPTYKRLTLMLRDPDRLRALLLDSERPIQLVIAGKSHPADDSGKMLIQQMVQFADAADVRHRIAFLPDYDMSMARFLYAGCDVWLNNPMRPLEACGTSGMKSALNGGLNLSIRDGWWDEFFDGANGWAIPSADGVADQSLRDDLEAGALYDLLSNKVLPLFYTRDRNDLPVGWLAMVRHALVELGPSLQASRMVWQYVESCYGPAFRSADAMFADSLDGAKKLAEYRARVKAAWIGVHAFDVTVEPKVGHDFALGAPVTIKAAVDLNGLDPSEVDVQAVLGKVDTVGDLIDTVLVSMSPHQSGYYVADVSLPHAGQVGCTIRVLPKHELLTTPAELGRIVLAG